MHKLFILLFGATIVSMAQAQDVGIRFMNNPKWSEVLERAKSEDKLIFLDCYTVWCGPCKGLSENTFPDKAVGEFFNPQFINVKMDMEKGEGVELNKQYKQFIPGYPSLLFINKNGEVVHQMVGYKKPEDLIRLSKEGLSGKTIANMQKRYPQEKNNIQFVVEYVGMLDEAFKPQEANEIVNNFIKESGIESLKQKEVLEMYLPYLNSVYSPEFYFMVHNSSQLIYRTKGINQFALTEKMNLVMSNAVRDLIQVKTDEKSEHITIDLQQERIDSLKPLLLKYSFKLKSEMNAQLFIHELVAKGDYRKAINYITYAIDMNVFIYPAFYISNYARYIIQETKDKKILKPLYTLLLNNIPNSKNAEYDYHYYRPLAQLAKIYGDKDKMQQYQEIYDRGLAEILRRYQEYINEDKK